MNIEKYLKNLKEKITEINLQKAVIGLSGGKDSNIVAKLMVDMLGKENVIGVMIPNGSQNDPLAIEISQYLGINTLSIDIADSYISLLTNINKGLNIPEVQGENYVSRSVSSDTKINLAPRLRMSVLYAVAQSLGNGWRVVGTTNKSEDYIGWLTKWGDGGVDFEPIINLTVRDLHTLGKHLGLPDKFVFRIPVDGLTPETDEDRFGFSYEQLDDYIEYGSCGNSEIDEKIRKMHLYSEHKRTMIPRV